MSFKRSFTRYFDEGVMPGDLVVSAVATEGGWLTAFAGWAAARQAVRQVVLAGIRTE